MATIPEAHRRFFSSGIVEPDFGAVAAAQRQSAGLSGLADKILERRDQELVAQAAEFNSRISLQFEERFTSALKSGSVRGNPSSARSVGNQIIDNIQNSDEFKSAPRIVQLSARKQLAQLRLSAGKRAISYAHSQSLSNVASSLNKAQENIETQAYTTDTPLNDLLKKSAAIAASAQKSGVLSSASAEKHLNKSASKIIENRTKRYLKEGDLDGASEFASDPTVKEYLGPIKSDELIAEIDGKKRLLLLREQKLEKLKTTNPWQYLGETDTETPPDINLASPENLADQFDDRVQFIERKQKERGVNLPLLNEGEENQIITTIDSVGPTTGAVLLNQVTTKIPDETQGKLAEQVMQKSPVLGAAIAIADQDQQTAKALLNGERVKKGKLIRLPPAGDLTDEVNSYIGTIINQPKFRAVAMEAVSSLYADAVFNENDNSGAIQSKIVKKSIEKLLGPIVEFNDTEIFSFRKPDGKFLSEDDFEDFVDDIDDADILLAQGDMPRDVTGKGVHFSDIRDNANLLVVGDGKYLITMFDEVALDKNGDVYILDLQALYEKREEIARRRQLGEN